MQSQVVKSRRPKPFWHVLAVVIVFQSSLSQESSIQKRWLSIGRLCLYPGRGTQSWTRNNCNYSGLEVYNECLKRPAQNFQDVWPNTLAILEAYNRCLKRPGKKFQYLGARWSFEMAKSIWSHLRSSTQGHWKNQSISRLVKISFSLGHGQKDNKWGRFLPSCRWNGAANETCEQKGAQRVWIAQIA